MDDVLLYRRQRLLADGYTDRELRRWLRDGDLTLLRRGSYLSGEPPDAHTQHRFLVRATYDLLDPQAVVSHTSAAVLHRLPIWGARTDRVEVTRQRRSGGRRHRVVHVRTARLDADEITEVDGIPVTSVARTVVDLARTVSFESAVVTADAALATGLVDAASLTDVLRRMPRWPGCPGARRVVTFADGRSESVGESRSRVALAYAGLPAPVPQAEVLGDDGRLLARVDFGWLDRLVVGEFDGKIKYGRLVQPGQSAGDVLFDEKRREDALRATGLTVVRWTWDDLAAFTPIAQRLRRALG